MHAFVPAIWQSARSNHYKVVVSVPILHRDAVHLHWDRAAILASQGRTPIRYLSTAYLPLNFHPATTRASANRAMKRCRDVCLWPVSTVRGNAARRPESAVEPTCQEHCSTHAIDPGCVKTRCCN